MISAVAGPTLPSRARAKVADGPSTLWSGTAAPPGIACTAAVLPAIRGSSMRSVRATTNCFSPDALTVFRYAAGSIPSIAASACAEAPAWAADTLDLSIPTR